MIQAVEPLITADQLASLLGLHPMTIYSRYRRGEIRGMKLGAKTLRFRYSEALDDMQAFVDGRTREGRVAKGPRHKMKSAG